MFKLKAVELKNFRSFQEKTRITIDNITTFIGKNDAGKSTVLEALEIFFNNDIVKIEQGDFNVFSNEDSIIISCIFENSERKIILDETAKTTISQEYLLNRDGEIQIIKEFKKTVKNPKETVYIKAMYPSAIEEPLINLTNNQLKKIWREMDVEDDSVLKNSNVSLRKGIYKYLKEQKNFELKERKIMLSKQDGKKIWDNIQKMLPMYALFQADRPSNDSDNEVQDPMKVAVRQALHEVEEDLEKVKKTVKEKALEIANNTLTKLQEMDSELAKELSPSLNEPKWDNIFKLSLDSEHGIPMNKRGSGVRRLILLNFFRSEVERQRLKEGKGVIYAIEEPETAQHPDNQKLLIEVFKELANDSCQVILTTHVPGVAEMLPTHSIRYIDDTTKKSPLIHESSDKQLVKIAEQLGVIPSSKIKLIILVEGKNDVNFLKHVSKILYYAGKTKINLFMDNRIAFIPTGGVDSLKDYINNKYLRGFEIPEIYIADKDDGNHKKIPKAVVTQRREMENYIHPDVIINYFIEKFPSLKKEDFTIDFMNPDIEIPKEIHRVLKSKEHKFGNKAAPREDTIKNWLNTRVVSKMKYEHLKELNVTEEIEGWFKFIEEKLK